MKNLCEECKYGEVGTTTNFCSPTDIDHFGNVTKCSTFISKVNRLENTVRCFIRFMEQK